MNDSDGVFGIRWFWHAVFALLAVTTAALLAIAFVRISLEQRAAAAEVARYSPPPAPSLPAVLPTVSIVGDSYVGGSDMNSDGDSTLWWSLAAKQLKFTPDVHAVGGSGYVAVNSQNVSGGTFVSRAALIAPNAKVVVFLGSRNDDQGSQSKLASAASSAFAEAKRIAPKARLVVIGPPWVDSTPPSYIMNDRDAIERAAKAAGATWVDPVQARWFPTGSGLIGKDGVHPTDEGHKHLAELIEPVLRKALG